MPTETKVKPVDSVEEILRFIGYKRTEAEKIKEEKVLAEFTEKLKKEGYSLSLMEDFTGRLRAAGYPPNYIAGAISVLLGRRAEEAEKEFTLERQIKLIEKLPGDIGRRVAEELTKVSLNTTSKGWAAEANIDLSIARTHPQQLGYYLDGADTIYMLPDSTGVATLYLDDMKHGYDMGTYFKQINYPFNTLWIENTAQADAYLHIQIAKGNISTQKVGGAGLRIAHTTTPLGANGVYTSGVFNAIGFQRITMQAYSDQGSAANGLEIQQSIDGTNWDRRDRWTLAAATARAESMERYGQYVRVRLTNGGTDQTVLRLAAFVR